MIDNSLFFPETGNWRQYILGANKIKHSLKDTLLNITWLIHDFKWFFCDALHFTTFKTNIIDIVSVVPQRKETGGSIFENVVYTVKVTRVYKGSRYFKGRRVQILTTFGGAACGSFFTIGSKYIITGKHLFRRAVLCPYTECVSLSKMMIYLVFSGKTHASVEMSFLKTKKLALV